MLMSSPSIWKSPNSVSITYAKNGDCSRINRNLRSDKYRWNRSACSFSLFRVLSRMCKRALTVPPGRNIGDWSQFRTEGS